MNTERRNKNRGYQQLLVWQDAIELYGLAFGAVRGWPFEQIDTLIFRLENRLLKLVESLERKRDANDWTETLVVREDPIEYGTDPAVTHDLRILLNGAVD